MLEAVAQESEGLSNAEISRKLNIPKSSASYILRTLETQGYLTRDVESGKYRVGLKILSLSRGALGGRDVRGIALPIMRHLTHQTGLTCHLAVLDGPEAVYIEKVEPEGFIRMDTWVGRRMRVHATSVGKAIVAYIPQEQLEQILRKSGMEKRTPKTITTLPRLVKELEKVRTQGYAVDDEENNLGARCVGAPIFDERGSIEASLGLSGTTQQVSPQTMPRILEALKDAARHISMGMGYRPAHVGSAPSRFANRAEQLMRLLRHCPTSSPPRLHGRARQRHQNDPLAPLLHQRPSLRALVAKPVPVDLPGPQTHLSRGRRSCISQLCRAIGLYQEQLALAQAKKWCRTLRIRAVAEHGALRWTPLYSALVQNLSSQTQS